MRIKRGVILCLTLLLLLNGCAGSQQEEESSGESRNEESSQQGESSGGRVTLEQTDSAPVLMYPAEGGTLYLAVKKPSSLLPWEVQDENTGKILMLLYSPLVNMNTEGEAVPCLAESWSFSDDLTEMTLHLKTDVTFHNGQRFTAVDVVYSVQKLKSADNVFSDTVHGITSATALDESTVLLHFAAPGRTNEEGLVFPIVPDGYQDKMVPMGTGPFRYETETHLRQMEFARFEDYFGSRPYAEKVTVYYVEDEAAIEQCFTTTRTNLLQMDSFSWGNYANRNDWTIHKFESYEALYLEFNQSTILGGSLSNRQKIAYAVDAERVLRDAYWGKGSVTETLLRPGSWYQGHTTKEYGYDAEKAAAMETEGNGKLRLLYTASDPVQTVAAETIRQQLEAVGVYVMPVESGEYDVVLRRERVTLLDVAAKMKQENCLAAAVTDAQVMDAVADLDERMMEELPFYTLFFFSQGTVSGYGIKGELTPSDWNVFAGIEDLYMVVKE